MRARARPSQREKFVKDANCTLPPAGCKSGGVVQRIDGLFSQRDQCQVLQSFQDDEGRVTGKGEGDKKVNADRSQNLSAWVDVARGGIMEEYLTEKYDKTAYVLTRAGRDTEM